MEKSSAKVWGSAIKSIQQLDIHEIVNFFWSCTKYCAVTQKPRVIFWKTFMVQQEEISNRTCFLKGLRGIMFLDNLPLSAHIKMHLTPSWSHLARQQQQVNTLWSRPADSSCECVCVCVCVLGGLDKHKLCSTLDWLKQKMLNPKNKYEYR